MTRRDRRAIVSAMLTNSLEAAVAMRTATAIEVRGVRKAYGDVKALDGVELTVRRGEVLALLGPNGAGKTTLVEILEGHRRADAGDVRVLGFDPARRERAFRERIGIVLQDAALERELTVREAIELFAAAYPQPLPAEEVAELVGLGDRLEARTRTLSGGQRRRLDVAVGIAGDPGLIFLDEPTTGFDPAARRRSWELIEGLRDRGRTILLTTHYMEEAQRLADRVAVLAGGRLIADAALGALRSEVSLVTFRLPAGVSAVDLPVAVEGSGSEVALRTAAPTRDPRAAALVGGGARLRARGPDRHPPEPRGRLPGADRMTRSLLLRWIAARVRLMLRNPRVTFFTFAFPLMFLVIFSAINGDVMVAAPGPSSGDVRFAQFYAPSIGIFGLTLACNSNVIFGLANARDERLLKRVRGAPLPMGVYLASWLAGAVLLGIASVVLMFAVAVPVFGVDVYPRLLPAAVVTVLLGAACLAALGLAVTRLVRNADQAGPVAQLTLLPLSFISGIWWPLEGAPDWLATIAHAFPLYYIVDAFGACFVPQTTGGGWAPGHLAVIAGWGLAGLLVAVRRFQAEPHEGERGRLRSRLARDASA